MRTTLVVVLLLSAVTACGIGLAGAGHDEAITGADAAPPAADGEGGNGNDASPDAEADAAADVDADVSQPDAGCDTSALVEAGVLAITNLGAAPTLDGKLDEWGCVPFVTLDKGTAAYALSSLTSPSGSFAVAYAGADLYVAAKIADPDVGGSNTTDPFYNDSVEIYLDGTGVLSGSYGTYDHQYVIDWKTFIKDYGPNGPGVVPSLSDISAAVQKPSGGWSIEVKIALSTLNISGNPAGKRIGFDMDLTEGSGTTQDQMLIWYMGPGTASGVCSGAEWCCGSASLPYCDTKRFGYAQFVP